MPAIEDILLSQITLFKEKPDGSLEETDDFDLSFLVDVTLIETVDISGPRLILTMDDPNNYIMEDLEARPRDVLKVTFSSHWYEGDGDNIDLVVKFRILTMPQNGRAITFNCMEKEVEASKQPAKKAILFTEKPVSEILKKLLPGLKPKVGKFPVTMDYHVLPGVRPSKTIRQMCHEMKAACFNRRGTVVFETWQKLLKQEPEYTYHHTPPPELECDEEIFSYEILRAQAIVKDRVERNYMSWSLTDGIVSTSRALKKAAEWVAPSVKSVLDNMLTVPLPSIDMMVSGQGTLQPGMVMELVWHSDNPEKPIDESLPNKILISTVAHYYSGSNYLCRVKGIRLV